MLVGTIVKSKAGRDKETFLVVVKSEANYAMLCDGKKRPMENPKHKKLIHLAVTNTVLSENCLTTNKQIRKALREYRENKSIQ